MPQPADRYFVEKALSLPPRVDDILLLSDIWLRWDDEKPSRGARIEALDLNGKRRLFWVKFNNHLEAMTGELIVDFRPYLWRYRP
jgi:hypothetical protein